MRDLPTLVTHTLRRHRRIVAAGCAATAVAIGLGSLAPAKPASARVIAAARDIAGGAVLKPDDVRWLTLPVVDKPAGALTTMSDVVGHAVAGPIRNGEALTDVRLVGGGPTGVAAAAAADQADAPLAPPGDGLVAAPVRLADVQAAELLRVGERVDVLAATASLSGSSSGSSTPTAATVVADDVQVLAIPTTPNGGDGGLDSPAGDGALVVLGATPEQARALAQAQLSARLSAVVVR